MSCDRIASGVWTDVWRITAFHALETHNLPHRLRFVVLQRNPQPWNRRARGEDVRCADVDLKMSRDAGEDVRCAEDVKMSRDVDVQM